MSAQNTHRWWAHLLRLALVSIALLIVSGPTLLRSGSRDSC